MRAFLALPLPEHIQEALERLQDTLPLGRAVAPENLHLTLAFLDEQPEAHLRALHEQLSEIKAPVLELQIKGVNALGGKTPRVLVADVVPDPGLVALQRRIRNTVQAAGIALPRVRFRPHVTLMRFARRMEAAEMQPIGAALQGHGDFSLSPFHIDHFALFQSTLLPEGPRYEVLAEYPLGEEAAGS